MSHLISYKFNSEKAIRVIDNEWFVASDVCKGLEITDASQAVRQIKKQLDDAEIKGTFSKRTPIKTTSGTQEVVCVNEAGLNLLIMQSRKKEAMPYKWWVASEVLPSIRKTGSYSLKINDEQQYQIKEAVMQLASKTGKKHATIYRDLYNHFKIPRYQDLLVKDFQAALKFLQWSEPKQIQNSNTLFIPFSLACDGTYQVLVKNGKALKRSVHYAENARDIGTLWGSPE